MRGGIRKVPPPARPCLGMHVFGSMSSELVLAGPLGSTDSDLRDWRRSLGSSRREGGFPTASYAGSDGGYGFLERAPAPVTCAWVARSQRRCRENARGIERMGWADCSPEDVTNIPRDGEGGCSAVLKDREALAP